MPDDPYVPAGGWEAAGYNVSNFVNPTPVYTPAPYTPQMAAPQQLINYSSGIQAGPAAQTTNYQPQQLIASPTQQGYGMTGPLMTNQFSTSRGGAGGGNPAIAQPGTVQNTTSAGGYSGGAPLGGMTLDQWARSMGGASIGDGQYVDSDGARLDTSRYPYGDLLGSQFPNPYGDLSGSQPSNSYGDLSGVPAMTPPSPYGDLSGSQPTPVSTAYQAPQTGAQMPTTSSTYGNLSGSQNVATGGASLGGYQPQPTYASPAGGAQLSLDQWARTQGGASIGDGRYVDSDGRSLDTSRYPGFQAPTQNVQMPTTPSTYGGLPNTAATGGATLGGNNPFDLNNYQAAYSPPANVPTPPPRPANLGSQWQTDAYGFPRDDQTYMDIPQGQNGQYGSLMGGQEYGQENPWAQSIGSNGNPNPGTVQINTPPSPTPVSTQPQSPNTGAGAQMPGTASSYGALPMTLDTWARIQGAASIGDGRYVDSDGGAFDTSKFPGGAGLFAAGQPSQPAQIATQAFGDINRTFGAGPSNGIEAISRAMGTPNIFGGN